MEKILPFIQQIIIYGIVQNSSLRFSYSYVRSLYFLAMCELYCVK